MKKFIKKLKERTEGFTLVELIVVIAILAILAGIAVPAYSGYIKNANDAAVETELSAISTAAMAANATAGELTNIVVKASSTTGKLDVTITGVTAKNFVSDFKVYYTDIEGTLADGTYTVTIDAPNAWNGSNYKGKTTTWTPSANWSDPTPDSTTSDDSSSTPDSSSSTPTADSSPAA